MKIYHPDCKLSAYIYASMLLFSKGTAVEGPSGNIFDDAMDLCNFSTALNPAESTLEKILKVQMT